MRPEEALERLLGLGFDPAAAAVLHAHFSDAEQRGKLGHGYSRVGFLETLEGLDPQARPELVESRPGFERWHGRGAVGYLTLAAATAAQVLSPPDPARLVVLEQCFPTGMLGHYARGLADAGLVAVLTATSPRRLPHPDGGPALTSTAPLAIGIPSPGGAPVVVDVSMARATWGDVLRGAAAEEDVVPFGGEQAHKAFALAVGLQLLVDALAGPGHGAVMLVARPEHDPVPALRELAAGARLPGDS